MDGSPRRRLALAWIAGFSLIDSSIVSLALADIAQDLDRPIGDLAWVSTGFLLALAATLLAAGALSDRLGARRVLTAGAIGFLVTTAASGLAPDFDLLVLARVAQGVAGGVLYTVSLAIATTVYPPERRASAIAIYFTSGALGAVIGPIVGGVLTDLGGWRLVFIAQLPIPIIVAVAAWLLLRDERGHERPFDVPGLAAASLFVVAATFALLQIPNDGAGPAVLAGMAVAVVALVAFIWRERNTEAPAVDLAIFRNARFVIATLAGAGSWFAIMAYTIYTAIYLQLGRGFEATDAGLLLLAGPLTGLMLFPVAGRLVRWLGVDLTQLIGLAVLFASAVVRATWTDSTEAWFVFVTNLGTGIGISITLVASATDALSQFAPHQAGTGSALFNSLRQLGAAVGVALPAVAFELVALGSRDPSAVLAGSTAAFLLQAVVLAIPLAAVLVGRRLRREPVGATSRAIST
jgi:DHA2 family methylenomycin A resistance protein-like MFS transporter